MKRMKSRYRWHKIVNFLKRTATFRDFIELGDGRLHYMLINRYDCATTKKLRGNK